MCGLFCIINHSKRQLDKRAFISLGCANDSRGGDACGIMIDGQVDKGTDKTDKYFQNWYKKSELLKKTNKCLIAFGHCRKASVGGVSADKAQPVVINDNNGKMLFCMIHNGTIYNYEELAKKYIPDVNIKDMSDSQVMAQIFFKTGYEVLQEYRGAGAFIIQDYRTNKTLIFRGESLGTLYTKVVATERPLYLVKTGKSIIISSIDSILQGLYWGFDVYEMPSNVLLECNGSEIYEVKKYDRSKCYHCKPAVSTVINSNYKSTGTYKNSYYDSLWDDAYPKNYLKVAKVNFDSHLGVYYNQENNDDLHGMIYVSALGYISKYSTGYNKPYYFWRGLMISGERAYNQLRDCHKEGWNDKELMYLAKHLSCNPYKANKKWWTYDANHTKVPFTEDYLFPLTDVEILCNEEGKLLCEYNNEVIESFVPVDLSEESINKIVTYVKNCIQRNRASMGAIKQNSPHQRNCLLG